MQSELGTDAFGLTNETRDNMQNLSYIRQMIGAPRRIGSIAPSGSDLAAKLAENVDPSVPGFVVEFGPGTGAITRGILDRGLPRDRLVLIERHEPFLLHLKREFPGVEIIPGDAWQIDLLTAHRLASDRCACIVSGLPLLNFPKSERLKLRDRIAATLAPSIGRFAQFSYGLYAPVEPGSAFSMYHSSWIFRNLPPARVWLYLRSG